MKVVDAMIDLLTGSLLNCSLREAPHTEQFFREMPRPFIVALSVASVICLMTVALAALHIVYVTMYITQSDRKLFIVFLASTAPFVSVAALVTMYMPRIWFLSHLISFLYFSVALWVIICLLMHIFGGHFELVKQMSQRLQHIEVATPPFCCVFPCLPKVKVNSRKIRICEWMVIQAPIVRLMATLASLVIYFEYQEHGLVPLKIIDLLTLPSLLAGIYGTQILVATVSRLEELISYRYTVVFNIFDFFFFAFGLQQNIFDFLARVGAFGCGEGPLPAVETSFFWKNFCSVLEAFFVTIISTILLQPSRSAFFDKHPSCQAANVQGRSNSPQQVDEEKRSTEETATL